MEVAGSSCGEPADGDETVSKGEPELLLLLEVEEEVLRAHLFMFKYKTRSLVWEGGPATEGSLVSFTDIEFYIDGVRDDDDDGGGADGDDARLVYGWLTCCVCVFAFGVCRI